MKVLFIGARTINEGKIIYDNMDEHIIYTLISMSHECRHVAYRDQYITGININTLFEKMKTDLGLIRYTPNDRNLFRELRQFKPDLVLILLGNYSSPELIHELRKISGVPVVVWCQDHVATLGRQNLIGSEFDHVFVKDRYLADLLVKHTSLKNIHYLPEACNPAIHRPEGEPEDELGADITSAGTLYYFRAEALASLSDFSIKIWGAVPRFYRDDYKYNILKYHQGRSIFTAEKARAFRQSKIVLNTLAPAEIGGVNARCFEAAACGAFQLITYNDYVKNYFKPGSEIECFRNLSELREKAEYYLDHEDERKMIANSACRRAHSEHTYERRLQQLLDTVFG